MAGAPDGSDLPLGKASEYPNKYAPDVLVSIARDEGRAALGIGDSLPFEGVDVWNAYELSWLTPKGKPVVATAEIRVPATSPNIVESKSLKLYLNSLNQERYPDTEEVRALVRDDLAKVLGVAPELTLARGPSEGPAPIVTPRGACLDALDVEIPEFEDVAPEVLDGAADPDDVVEMTCYSHLLKSNCPVTGQPDWATVTIAYRGPRIDRTALLRYIVSFRNHDDFHERCVERMWMELKGRCAPDVLCIAANYTRRGGIDICPWRGDPGCVPPTGRSWRQ